MAFQLDNSQNLGKQTRKDIRKRLERALIALEMHSRKAGSQDKAVHTARKRIREARALLRLMRYALGKKKFRRENRILRDACRPLSEMRDAAALLEALETLREDASRELPSETFESLIDKLRERRRKLRRRFLKEANTFSDTVALVEKVLKHTNRWDIRHGAPRPFESGLRKTREQSQKAMATAIQNPADEHLHEWRKRTKDLRYQLEMLAPLNPALFQPAGNQARELTELLGLDHDLAVLSKVQTDEFGKSVSSENTESLHTLIDRHRKRLQASAQSSGAKLYTELMPQDFLGTDEKRSYPSSV